MRFLSQLIALRTVTGDQKQQKKAIDLIDQNITPILKSRSFHKDGYCSKIFYSADPTIFDVLFVVHIDVVNGHDGQFSLKKKGDRLCGRGVFDMKGPAVAVIQAINDYCENKKGKKSVGLLVTFDEEIGGYNGVKIFLEKNDVQAGVVVVPDGGDNIQHIVMEEKGVVNVEISFKGISAHASRPWEGKNAVICLMNIIQKITNHYSIGDGTKWKTIASLIDVRSETVAQNAIPHVASAKFMFRYIKKDHVEDIITYLRSLDDSLQVDILGQGDALKVSSKDHYIKIYRAIVEDKTKKKCILVKYHSTCDARYFAQRGMPVIISRPEGGCAHGKDEWVSQVQLGIFSEIILDFLCAVEKSCE